MSNAAAREYLEICKGMSWEKGVMPYLLAGWVVIAPLCGILNWRPHLWMIGPAGVGKSTIFTYLVSRMLGKFKMAGQGMGTTEAGIRQALASDALPYIADEMDATTLAGQAKLKVTLELFRSMSTAEGPKMLKGSGDGTSVGYELRSCVFLSSISAPLDVRADISRFYVLSLVKSGASDAREAWKQKLKHLQATLTDDYVERFQARTIAMIPVILQNISVFGAAAVDALGDQRLGDQLGPLLAGAWSLVSNTVVSYEVALDWIKGHEWEVNGTSTQDEVQLLESIMDTLVLYKGANGGQLESTVAQLVRAVAYAGDGVYPSMELADNVLRQRGMRVDGVYLYFAKNGEWFKEILKGRPFDVKILRNVAGAEDGGERKLSFAGTEKRWVRVPLASCGLTGVVAVDSDGWEPPF
jgi:putative DNA primase/helicase